jgi:hypothetical protein
MSKYMTEEQQQKYITIDRIESYLINTIRKFESMDVDLTDQRTLNLLLEDIKRFNTDVAQFTTKRDYGLQGDDHEHE